MRSINKVIILGNLTRDVDFRDTAGGVATFGVATNRTWQKDGQRQTAAEFHELVAFGRLAESCSSFLSKGDLVYIEGYLKTRSWEDEAGTKRFKTEIVVGEMIRLTRGEKADMAGASDHADHGEHPEAGEDAAAPAHRSGRL